MRRLTAFACSMLLVGACSGTNDEGSERGDTDTMPTTASATDPAGTAATDTTATVASTTTAPAAARPATVDELLALGRPIVLAHTAGEDEYPASTLFGFTESVRVGVDMLDLNVQLSKDGVLVVHHDDTVDRATDGSGAVAELTYDQLAALDDAYWFTAECGVCTDQPDTAYLYRGIRTGERAAPEGYGPDDFAIPTFRQVVERFPDLPLNVEIKGEGEPAKAAADVLAAELLDLGRADATVVASFDDEIVSYFHQIAPDVEVSPGLDALTAWALERTPIPDGMRILQLPPEYSGLRVITGQLVTDSTAAGYPIWVWPNNRSLENEASYLDFLSQGIAGLNINFPSQGVAAVQQFTAAGSVGAVASAGCTVTDAAMPGEATVAFTGAGQVGTYIRHLPPAYDGTTPLPIVVDLHGWSEPAAVHVLFSGLAAHGDDHRFVTLVPDITRPVPRWDMRPDGPDMRWLAALLDEAEATLCVDTARFFVAGMSNGAMMTSAVACGLAERVAAVAPVAGVQDPSGCDPVRPVPMVAFHGTDDQFLPYEGGIGPAVAGLPNAEGDGTLGTGVPAQVLELSPVPDTMAAWATRNGCAKGEPSEATIASDVTELVWNCPSDGETVLYRIEGGGHTWPGSAFGATISDMVGTTTSEINANAVMWQFFLRHPLGAA